MTNRNNNGPTRGNSFPNSKGFSLVELMIVLVLIGVALIPLSGIQFSSRRTVVAASRYADAVALAQQSLESMRGSGFANAPTDTVSVDGFTVATATAPYVDPGSGVAVPSVEQLTVAVTWNERGTPMSINLDCLRSQR